jgi:16S rRNA A1518/A1519 N6-dimethyltransferase RsmA/KsgA/DIM1 with predicted DNA glycosylase/AP lyase activity
MKKAVEWRVALLIVADGQTSTALARFEVLAGVLLKIQVSWDVTPCTFIPCPLCDVRLVKACGCV